MFVSIQASQFYVASFWLLPTHYNVLMPPPSVSISQMPVTLKRIAMQSGAEVVFKSNCFEIYGLADETSVAIQLISDLDMVKVTILFESAVNLLPILFRDFITRYVFS
jgi:hypothetical protein